MITVEFVNRKRKELEDQLCRLTDNANAVRGAIQFCDLLLAEASKPAEPEGIPLEQLFPGAVIVDEASKAGESKTSPASSIEEN